MQKVDRQEAQSSANQEVGGLSLGKIVNPTLPTNASTVMWMCVTVFPVKLYGLIYAE